MNKRADTDFLRNLEAQHDHASLGARGENILAIDYGTKFTGVAVADRSGAMIPVGVWETDEDLATKVQTSIRERNIQRIVFGLPLNQDGSLNPLCKMIKKFAQKLKVDNVEIDFVNEKYSSQMTMGKEDERIDDLAALRILEFYLAQK